MRNSSVQEKLKFKKTLVSCAIGVAIAATSSVTAAVAAEPSQEAHDTYCIACHNTSVYTRENRQAADYDAVRAQVDRWQSTISLNWSAEEIDRMAVWLANRYYQIPCPDRC